MTQLTWKYVKPIKDINAIANFENKSGIKFPDDLKEKAKEVHAKLIDEVVTLDDSVMEKYMEGIEPDIDTVKKLIRKGTISQTLVPVLCGTAFKNKGVQPLLDAVVDYLPSPLDVPAIKGVNPKTEKEEERK